LEGAALMKLAAVC